MDVNLAEEGVLRLLFASVYQIFVRVGSENEFVLASRFIFSNSLLYSVNKENIIFFCCTVFFKISERPAMLFYQGCLHFAMSLFLHVCLVVNTDTHKTHTLAAIYC